MAFTSPEVVTQQRHVPRLQYRNNSSTSVPTSHWPDLINTTSINESGGMVPKRPMPGPLGSVVSPKSVEFLPGSGAALDCHSAVLVSSPLKIPSKRPKKKSGSIFGFFSVKEPSQQAFEDYQRQLRKKQNSRDGRVPAIGIPGVSSAKMPPTVPKVNSKWDGVPQAIKEKEKEKEGGRRSRIGSDSRSISTARSDESTDSAASGSSRGNRPRYKLPSNSDSSLADVYGWESSSACGDICGHDGSKQPSISPSAGVPLSLRPFRSQIGRHDDYLRIQLPPLPAHLAAEDPRKTESDVELFTEPPIHCFSPALTPSESSPVTPDWPFPATNSQPFPKIKVSSAESHPTIKDDIRTTVLKIPSPEEVIVRSFGVQVLGAPATARRKERLFPTVEGEVNKHIIPRDDCALAPIIKRGAMTS